MDLVICEKCGYTTADREIFSDISLTITDMSRLALVGRNGSGKTTLLKLIRDDIRATNGNVFRKKWIKIGFLQQEQRLSGEYPLIDAVLRENSEWWKLYVALSAGKVIEDSSDDAMTRFLTLGGYALRNRCMEILSKLGFDEDKFLQPVDTLSGGERNRAAIAAILLIEPDLMLLDEPTNHIDYGGLKWLAKFLRETRKPFIIVSHDRHFLDIAVDETAEIIDGRLYLFKGGYSEYCEKKHELEKHLLKEYRHQREIIAKTEEFIRRNIAGQKTKQAQSRRKMLGKMERIAKPVSDANAMKLRLGNIRRGGDKVLQIEGLRYEIDGKLLIGSFNVIVGRGEHIGIVGSNGCGKTTLLKLITSRIPSQHGNIIIGEGISVAYYAQDFDDLSNESTPFDEIAMCAPYLVDEQISAHLGAFSISNDEAFRPVRTFSGGERARIVMAKLVLSKANLLLLDEPTNHLDINARTTLEKALKSYPGTMLVVSHDRYFLDEISDKIWAFENGNIINYTGNFSYYLSKYNKYTPNTKITTEVEREMQSQNISQKDNAQKITSKYQHMRNERKLKELEERITELENERRSLVELLSEPYVAEDYSRVHNITKQINELDKKLDILWYELNDVI